LLKSPDISIYHPKSPEIPRNLHLSSLKSIPKMSPCFFFRPGRFLLCGWILLHLRLGLCGAKLRSLETHQSWQRPLELVHVLFFYREYLYVMYIYNYIYIYRGHVSLRRITIYELGVCICNPIYTDTYTNIYTWEL
jgi:hypothetical protein